MEDQFFDLSGRMGYIVSKNEYLESKLNYVLTKMLKKENPDHDPTVSIKLCFVHITQQGIGSYTIQKVRGLTSKQGWPTLAKLAQIPLPFLLTSSGNTRAPYNLDRVRKNAYPLF